MARSGLRAPLASALHEITGGSLTSVERDARAQANGCQHPVHLRITRLPDPGLLRPLFLLAFEASEEPVSVTQPATSSAASEEPPVDRATQLEDALRAAREDHQHTLEELQATNEELASANEEMQSVNEEFQSTNEELQTTKEETQSLNEELRTLNSELHAKASSLEHVNDDLRNLLDSTGIAIIFADNDLCVKRFTPAAQALVPLILSDIGRPLADISMTPDYPDLLADANEVLRTLAPIQRAVQTSDEQWYAVQIRPYRTARNTIEGVSIAFLDITSSKHAELKADATLRFAEEIIEALREPFLVLDAGLNVLRANRSFYRVFQVTEEDTVGRHISELGGGQWDIPDLRELLERLLPENRSFDNFEVDHHFPGLGRRVMQLNARRLEQSSPGAPEAILLAIEDVTDSVRQDRHDRSETPA